jgi:THAP domain-containing protein 4
MNNQVLQFLEGTWRGEGSGGFPTIDSFDYRERLKFECRDDATLFYEQRTEKRMHGETQFVTSHWESGFIRMLADNTLELVSAQSGGRSEVLVGTIEQVGEKVRLKFSSKAISNDPRIIATTRTLEIESDMLTYEMEMHTTSVKKITHHAAATLKRKV